jgi:hypothetical protein
MFMLNQLVVVVVDVAALYGNDIWNVRLDPTIKPALLVLAGSDH